ncbi:MAG: helix-turn-helix transcriptional regulator [bacterium]|nr:helix-turn-helix transcriptional regulator [bacterium]
MKNKLYTFKKHLKESLKNSDFKKEWKKSEMEYVLACELIEKRIARKMSQRELARRINTSQSVVSNIETMQANPSLKLLKRIALALDGRIEIRII